MRRNNLAKKIKRNRPTMKALIQRVTEASVQVEGQIVGKINQGLLVLLGVDQDDDVGSMQKLLDKTLKYRVFSDDQGKMNLSLLDTSSELLVISQFTLSADTKKGLRPSFTSAADPAKAKEFYEQFVAEASKHVEVVETGEFGADMKVSLINDGPCTFMLET